MEKRKLIHRHATPKADEGQSERHGSGSDKKPTPMTEKEVRDLAEYLGRDAIETLTQKPSKRQASSGQDRPRKTELPEFGNAVKVLHTKYTPLVQVIEDFILEGFTLFAGAGKLGKTTIFMQMAKAVCDPDGGEFLGRLVTPGKVLFISLEEDLESLQDKMRAQCWTEEEGSNLTIITSRQFYDNIGPLYTNGAIDALLRYIKAGKFSMVGVDNFKMAFVGLKFQNDSDTITQALTPIHQAANRRHFAFVMLDHHGHKKPLTTKRSRDPVEDVMSSSTKATTPDIVIGFYEDGLNKRTILIKGRRVAEQKLKLLYDPTTKTNSRLEGDEALDLTNRQAKIVQWLRSNGKPATNRGIAEGTGIAPSNTHPILKTLVAENILRYDAGPKTYEVCL